MIPGFQIDISTQWQRARQTVLLESFIVFMKALKLFSYPICLKVQHQLNSQIQTTLKKKSTTGFSLISSSVSHISQSRADNLLNKRTFLRFTTLGNLREMSNIKSGETNEPCLHAQNLQRGMPTPSTSMLTGFGPFNNKFHCALHLSYYSEPHLPAATPRLSTASLASSQK